MTTPQRGRRDFHRLWAAQAVSSVGARIAREGLPMAAVISLNAGPAAVGLFAALTLAAQALVGLAAGPLVDRLPKRALLIGADLARAAVLAAVPLAALAGRLSLAEIYVAGVLMGAFSVVFDIADHAVLPSLVAEPELVGANARLATTEAVAEVGGPAIAGALFQLVGPPVALAVNAVTYLVSALILGRLPRGDAPPRDLAEAETGGFDLAGGLRTIWGERRVRALWLGDVTRGFFGAFFAALYILFALNGLKLTPGMLGLTVAAGGVGGVIGATLAPRVTRWLGAGPAIILAGLMGGACTFLIPLAGMAGGAPLAAMAVLALAQVAGDGLQTIAQIGAVSLRQSLLPAAQLGRAGGAFLSGQALAGVAGALAGGWLGGVIGPRETLLIAAAGVTGASLFAILSPLRRTATAGENAKS